MRHPLVRSLAIAAVVFLGLLSPPARSVHALWFRASLNAVFASCGGDRMAELSAFEDEHHRFDTGMAVGSKRAGRFAATLPLSSTRQGLVPMACFFALLLATPTTWARRGRAALVGFVVLQGFTISRVAVTLLLGFNRVEAGGVPLLPLPGFAVSSLALTELALGSNLTTGYVVGLGCWAALCLRHFDLAALGFAPARDA